jgi:hypothetical protein
MVHRMAEFLCAVQLMFHRFTDKLNFYIIDTSLRRGSSSLAKSLPAVPAVSES